MGEVTTIGLAWLEATQEAGSDGRRSAIAASVPPIVTPYFAAGIARSNLLPVAVNAMVNVHAE